MVNFSSEYRIKVRNSTKQSNTSRMYKILKKGFDEKDSSEAIAFLEEFPFNTLKVSKESYVKILQGFEKLLICENDYIGYMEGILTLKKCYKSIGMDVNTSNLVNAMTDRVYNLENNRKNFVLDMQFAEKRGALTKEQYNKIIKASKYKKAPKIEDNLLNL